MTARRILVVDDDDDIRMLTAMSLTHVGGYDVRSCSGGAQGLELAKDWEPEAVLMDVRMPDMDGPTAARLLAADPLTAHIPIILITASVRREEQSAFAIAGIAGVLPKPFDPMTLPGQVASLLGWT